MEGRCPRCLGELLHRRRHRARRALLLLAGGVAVLGSMAAAGALWQHERAKYQLQVSAPVWRSMGMLRRAIRAHRDALEEHLARSPHKRDDPVPIGLVSADPAPRVNQVNRVNQVIEKVGAGRYLVQRPAIGQVINDPANLGHARIIPVRRDGAPLGFKLLGIRPGSIYRRLGLDNGDVVHRINGVRIKSPDQALNVYNRLKKANRITLKVLRRGRLVTLRYWITEEKRS